MSVDRIPPHSLEGEAALLGSMMVADDLIPIVLSTVGAGDFYAHVHQPIFEAISFLASAQRPVDLLTVAEELRTRNQLEKCGNVAYLRSLLDTVQSASTAEYWAKIVAEKATLRRLISAGQKIYDLGFNGEEDVDSALTAAMAQVNNAVTSGRRDKSGQHISTVLLEVYDELSDAFTSKTSPALSSPWPTLDRTTGGTFGGELCAWAAAPQVGKSIALAQLAVWIATHHGTVALFPLEMGNKDTTRRLLGKYAKVTNRKMRTGQLESYDWDRIGVGMAELQGLPIWQFDRTPRKTVNDVRLAVMRLSQDQPVKAVVIDHANFLADATDYGSKMSKHERLDRVYQELLSIASEFNCVMHVVQHLNRAGMDSEPSLANLRDGGNLEGHATVVVFPYRPNIEQDPTRAEFIVAKNRNNPLNRIPMYFDGAAQEWSESNAQEFAVT
jgi:replicative DNA helicase